MTLSNNKEVAKFKEGQVVKHILGETLLIVTLLNGHGTKWDSRNHPEKGYGFYNFSGEYVCKRSNFEFVTVSEKELYEQ